MFIMGSQRREFTSEYRDEAAKLVISTGRAGRSGGPRVRSCREYAGNWVKAYRVRQEAGEGALSETERAELGQRAPPPVLPQGDRSQPAHLRRSPSVRADAGREALARGCGGRRPALWSPCLSSRSPSVDTRAAFPLPGCLSEDRTCADTEPAARWRRS